MDMEEDYRRKVSKATFCSYIWMLFIYRDRLPGKVLEIIFAKNYY